MMKITWLADFDTSDHQGGAQQTNKIMIEAGIERGHKIDLMKPKDFDREKLGDLVITNNIVKFKEEDINWIIDNKKYIRYEHDYYGMDNIRSWHNLYNNSLLNIFLSPLHASEFRHLTYKHPERIFLQPSPVVGFYDKKEKRNKNLVLYLGGLNQLKGYYDVLKFAVSHPDLKFHFYGWVDDPASLLQIQKVSNCEYKGVITNDQANDLYNTAEYFIHIPRWKEPFGRTVLEAYLAGCHLIHNDNIGALSYNWDWDKYEEIKKVNESLTKKFWDKIETL